MRTRLPRRLRLIAGTALWLALNAAPAAAQTSIVSDGTMSSGGSISFSGGTYTIPQNAGTTVGTNLFHSFQTFGLNTGETADFTGGAISNIIARVTGGSASLIDGTIRSSIPGADLFLLNPAGVMFGPSASLDLSGNFSVSTADYVGFQDGSRFYADPAQSSSLVSFDPTAFGFLGPSAGGIIFNGPLIEMPGTDLTVVGGDVAVQNSAELYTYGGRMTVTAVAGPGEVVAGASGWRAAAGTALGMVVVSNSKLSAATIATDGRGMVIEAAALGLYNATLDGGSYGTGRGADILLSADAIDMVFAAVTADAYSTGDGGNITIEGDSVYLDYDSFASSNSYGGGAGGDITVTVGDLTLSGGSLLASNTYSAGDAGNVSVTATGTVTMTGVGDYFNSGLNALSSGATAGAAGTVAVTARTLVLDAEAIIDASTSGARDGGDITVTADSLTISGGAYITSATGGAGQGGNIRVVAGEALITGSSAFAYSGIYVSSEGTAAGSGAGGTVDVQAQSLTLSEGGTIGATSYGPGAAGTVSVTVAGDLTLATGGEIQAATWSSGAGGTIDVTVGGTLDISGAHPITDILSGIWSTAVGSGAGGNIAVSAGHIRLSNEGTINSSAWGAGDAGMIAVTAGTITMTDLASIESSTRAAGRAGDITVNAQTIAIDGVSAIESAQLRNGTGGAGDIRVTTGDLTLTDGGYISSETLGQGDAGDVSVTASGRITITGINSTYSLRSGILASSQYFIVAPTPDQTPGDLTDDGDGGSVTVSAGSLVLADGGEITASAHGGGDGGSVTVNVSGDLELTGGRIIAASYAASPLAGQAGSVTVSARNMTLSGGVVSALSEATNAGSLTLSAADSIVMAGAEVSTRAELGDGGDIFIYAPMLIHLTNSAVTSSVSQGTGAGGNITIDPVALVLDNSVIRADAHGGPGGNIWITVDNLFQFPGSVISASSALGVDGIIEIDRPQVSITDGLSTLPSEFSDKSALLNAACAQRLGSASSFVIAGRGGLPATPDDLMPSPLPGGGGGGQAAGGATGGGALRLACR